jgi:hypothetical protein
MKRNINNIALSILVLFIASIYFLVATSHIFLLKNRTRLDQKSRTHSNIIANKKIGISYSRVDDVSLIKMIDKTTVENKKTFNDFIKLAADFFQITLFFSALWLFKPRLFNIIPSGQLINCQNHYLSIGILRI